MVSKSKNLYTDSYKYNPSTFVINNDFQLQIYKREYLHIYSQDRMQEIMKASKFFVEEVRIFTTRKFMDTITLSKKGITNLNLLFNHLNLISGSKYFQGINCNNECKFNQLSLSKWFKINNFNTLGEWIAAIFDSIIYHIFFINKTKNCPFFTFNKFPIKDRKILMSKIDKVVYWMNQPSNRQIVNFN